MPRRQEEILEDLKQITPRIMELRDLNNDAEREWSAEDEQNWDEANKDYNALSRELERTKRFDEADSMVSAIETMDAPRLGDFRSPGRPDPGLHEEQGHVPQDEEQVLYARLANPEKLALAVQAWLRCGVPGEQRSLTLRQKQACQELRINPRHQFLDVNLESRYNEVRRVYGFVRPELRAQSTAPTEGGETIPEGFVNNFEKALLAYGGMRVLSRVIRTASGNPLPWPHTDDTAVSGAILTENTQVTEQDIVTAETVLNAYKYTSFLVRVSQELMEDSAFNMAAELGELLGIRIGRGQNAAYTSGTGTAQPQGIVNCPIGPAAVPVASFDGDSFIDLYHSVDPAYRMMPSTGFMMHDGIVAATRKFKESTGQYIWQPGLQAGTPDRLLGQRVVVNQDMDATVTAGNIGAIFGDHSRFIIRDVANFRLRRLDERYADFDQVGFVAFHRTDSRLLDAGTAPLKHLAFTT